MTNFFAINFLLCQQMKKISSSIWLSSSSCRLGRCRPAGVSRDLQTDLGVVRAGLRCDVLSLWEEGLGCEAADMGLKTSNNSTTEKPTLGSKKRKGKTLFHSIYFPFFPSDPSLLQRLTEHRIHLKTQKLVDPCG